MTIVYQIVVGLDLLQFSKKIVGSEAQSFAVTLNLINTVHISLFISFAFN